jgi:hypothetical protein
MSHIGTDLQMCKALVHLAEYHRRALAEHRGRWPAAQKRPRRTAGAKLAVCGSVRLTAGAEDREQELEQVDKVQDTKTGRKPQARRAPKLVATPMAALSPPDSQ